MTGKDLKDHFTELQRARTRVDSLWENVEREFLPVYTNNDGDIILNENLYDSAGIEGIVTQAEGLIGNLTNSASDWFGIHFEDDRLNNSRDSKMFLEDIKDWYLEQFVLTNFYDRLYKVYEHAQIYGTSAIFPVYHRGHMVFKTIHPRFLWINEDENLEVNEIVIKNSMNNVQIENEYGKELDSDKLETLKKAKGKHIVYITLIKSGKKNKKIGDKEWLSYHWLEDGTLIRTSGFSYQPIVIFKMKELSGNPYGYGTCLEIYQEMASLNTLSCDMLKLSNLTVAPPLQIPPELDEDDLDLVPDGRIWLDSNQQIRPIKITGDYSVGHAVREDIRARIREAFKVDFFRLLQTYQQRAMTATQVMELSREKAAMLGTLTNRIISGLLNPLFDAMFYLGVEYELLPELPPSLFGIAKIDKMAIDYTGVLAQMQKRFTLTSNIQTFFNDMLPLAQVQPQVFDNIDVDVLATEILEKSMLPPSVVRNKDEVNEIRQAREELQMAQEQAKLQTMQADAYSKMVKTPQEGSGAEAMMGGVSGY